MLARRYQEVYGETPHQHLLARRIERARHLLATTPLTVAEVCREVGFASLGSFTTTFTRLVDCAFRNPSGNMVRSSEPLLAPAPLS